MTEGLSAEQLDLFKQKGYLLVPNVLTKEEVALLRKDILAIFKSGDWKKSPYNTNTVLSDVYGSFPGFLDVTLSRKVLSIVKSILGENPVLMPETGIHYKLYSGWHKDTTSQEKAGHDFHWKPEALMIEAGVYLQDNNELGGGLTVMEGSHMTKDVFKEEHVPGFFEKIMNRISPPTQEQIDKKMNVHKLPIIDIPSRAGDLVIFNFLTNHRATLPKKCSIADIPADQEKLALFNAFSVNNATADEYIKYIQSRPEPFYQYVSKRKITPELVNKAKELGFTAY